MAYILKQYDYNLAYFDIYYDIEGFRVEKFNAQGKGLGDSAKDERAGVV